MGIIKDFNEKLVEHLNYMQIEWLPACRYKGNTKIWGHQEYKISPFPTHWTISCIHVLKLMKMYIFTKQERWDCKWKFPGTVQFWKSHPSPSHSHFSRDPVERQAQKSGTNYDLNPWANWLANTFLNQEIPQISRPSHKDGASSTVLMAWLTDDEKELDRAHFILPDHSSEKTHPERTVMGWESPRELHERKVLTSP